MKVACITLAVLADAATNGPFGVMKADRYPAGASLWDAVSEIFSEQASKLPGAAKLPSISLHRVKMYDGVGLDTIVINPAPYDSKKGTMLVRSPYGPTTENLADLFTLSNGYAAVLQDDRGTFLSGGKFDLWRGASADANATMTWITEQPWSNGDVFTAGVSADGINEAMAALAAPPMLKGQWFTWATANGHHMAYNGGAYRKDIIDGYLGFMNLEVHGRGKTVIEEVRHHEAYDSWWHNLTACPETDDDTHPSAPGCVYKNIKWPIVLTTGWWDIFQHTSVNLWNALRVASDPSVRDEHVHVVGPLGHCIIGSNGQPRLAAAEAAGLLKSFNVAKEMFKGEVGPTRSKLGRLNLYIMGGYDSKTVGNWNYWTSLSDWPAFSATSYFLQGDGSLALSPAEAADQLVYTYDPSTPTPMLGGNNLPLPNSGIDACGPADQSQREAQDDVMTFDSAPLAEDTAIVGQIRAKLFVSSSAKDTDFVVTLSDLSDTSSYLVRFGARRMRWREVETKQSEHLEAGKVYEADVDLSYTAYVFPKGHRIRIAVSSAAYPYYSANSNSGELDLDDEAPKVAAKNTIFISKDQQSQIILPVVSLSALPRSLGFEEEALISV